MAGKTNAKFIRVFVTDEVPTLRNISPDVSNVDIPINYSTSDVTGYSDGVINVTKGHPSMNITMSGPFSDTADTGAHDVLSVISIQDTPAVAIKIQIGIMAAPSGTDPQFTGNFHCVSYEVHGDATWDAEFMPGSGTAPAWGTYS